MGLPVNLPLPKLFRPGLFLLSSIAFFLSIWGGLYRIGWNAHPLFGEMPGVHGPLIVCGFLGTMFSIDRAMAHRSFWGNFVPVLILLGSFLLLLKPIGPTCPVIVLLGSLGFSLLCLQVYRQQTHLYNSMFFLGSLHWLVGIVIWFSNWPVFNIYSWWSGFILFTIVGQRLELATRMKREQANMNMLKTGLGLVLVGEIFMALGHMLRSDSLMDLYIDAIRDPRTSLGMHIVGVGILIVSLWLLLRDAAWPLLKNRGVAKFSALCMISSYFWLGLSGLFSVLFAGLVSGRYYDALIHAFFVGFVCFILFGHGPILILSSLNVRVQSAVLLYVPFFLLHGSLAIRFFGDLNRSLAVRKIGGLLNAASLMMFVVIVGWDIYQIKSISEVPAPSDDPLIGKSVRE